MFLKIVKYSALVLSVLILGVYLYTVNTFGIGDLLAQFFKSIPEERVVYDFGLAETAIEKDVNLSGDLLLSLLQKGSEEMRTYRLDISTTTSYLEIIQSNKSYGMAFNYTATGNIQTEGGFVLTSGPFEDGTIRTNAPDNGGVYYVPSVSSLTDGDLFHIKQPRGKNESAFDWSEKKRKLAYQFSNFVQNAQEFRDIANYSVSIYDFKTDTSEKIIEEAFAPNWSPDGEFLLFMKRDGLYRYSVELDAEKQVISLEGDGLNQGLNTGVSFKVSDDGQYAVWTSPYHNILTVYKIDSWQPFSMKALGKIYNKDTEYSHPRFSPDNNFYAVFAVERDIPSNDLRNARIEIRAIENRQILYVYPMNDYEPSAVYIGDWILPE